MINLIIYAPFFYRLASGGSQSAAAPGATNAISAPGSKPNPPYKSLVVGVFSFFNIGFMIFMAATGALGIASSNSTGSDTNAAAGNVFVGIYMMLFSAILFIYECIQICPVQSIDTFWKKNFGFLYGVIGKGIFILL